MYVIYIDVLFIINLCMDILIFFCATLILNQKIKLGHIAAAGLIAALIYCMLIVLPILQYVPYSIYAFFIPIPSILYLFKPRQLKSFFKLYILCTFVAAVFGGVAFNIWYVLGYSLQDHKDMGIFMLILIGVMITSCFYWSFYFIRRRLIFPAFEYQLDIKNHERQIEVKALLDTGNLLYTPISHEPVIVIQYEAVKLLLSEDEKLSYEAFCKSSLSHIEEAVLAGKYQVQYLIPFNSVGCKEGYLWGIRVEEVHIRKASGDKKVCDCIVGISREELFSDRCYQALLHPEFIFKEAMVS